jgi:3D (Asp-Asp-Asp) domain-containing protein
MGNFKLTAYCPCYSCSEGYGSNTASGARAQENRTIAVDPRVIPYGTIVVIERNGVFYEYVAEDCGGAIKNQKIDVFFNSHSAANNFGVRYGNVYIVK